VKHDAPVPRRALRPGAVVRWSSWGIHGAKNHVGLLVSRGDPVCSVLDASGRLTGIIHEGLMVVHGLKNGRPTA
jgi:hypothetical protein